jgi:hypothetical protein
MQEQPVEMLTGLMVYNMQASDINKQRLQIYLLEC